MIANFQKLYNSIFNADKMIDYGDGLYPDENFTGIWEVSWPNGRLKVRGEYVEGKEVGKYECFWENGKIAQEGQHENGECVGDWFDYWEDGKLYKQTAYTGDGNFKVFTYDSSGNVKELQEFVAGEWK